ncbi:unnamed protein product [Miscanthus lutarioriparius]|uniref:Uncharacterized protein n=1 Tax=Miscanthus lutarioriparius TaxID=422564 RepID=A0A811PDK3_9POAL|nr:unnamed protein product [Miscanthus lutarioriparius]
MNPPPRLFPIPFGELHGCDGDGCASDPDTWPLHHVLRRGVHCRLCSSCILLSHRSLYCCRCIFLVTSPSCNYDDGDTLMAPPAPTVTCHVCREAVAHLPCLYYPEPPADGVFVCPPCTAAQNGRLFTYAPPCRQPLDERGARVLVLGSRIALALLQRHATAARAAAERLAREAQEARKRANDALEVAYNLGKKEDPSWVVPQSPENDLAASEEEGNEGEANVGKVLLVRRNAMPSLATLTIGTGGSVVLMALAEAQQTPPSSQSKPLFDLNENAVENDLNENAAENETEAVQAEPTPHRALNSFNVKEVALNSFDMKEVTMAAAEAARASPPTPQTLQLFPSAKASSSTKMPRTKKPRTKRPRTLQLFNDDRA